MLDERDQEAEIEASLERLFAEKSSTAPTPSAHAKLLEDRLLDAFDARGRTKKKERPLMKSTWFRRGILMAAAAAVLGIAACAAPVDVDVKVGRTINVAYDATAAGAPKPQELAEFVGKTIESDLAAKRTAKTEEAGITVEIALENGLTAVHAEIWGGDPSLPLMGPRLKTAFPALAGVEVKEQELHGTVHESFAKKIGHEMLDMDLDTADVETARKEVMARLRAGGVEGKIDVDVRGGPNERQIRVRVEKEGGEPPKDLGTP